MMTRVHRFHVWHASSARAQLTVIGGKLLLILTVVALVAASVSARHFQHTICVNQNTAFSAVDQVIQHGVTVTQEKLKADAAAGRMKLVRIDRGSIAGSQILLQRIRTIHC